MKGKQHVLSEVNLMMICYNIKRLTSIINPKVLKTRLKALAVEILALFSALLNVLKDFLFLNKITTN